MKKALLLIFHLIFNMVMAGFYLGGLYCFCVRDYQLAANCYTILAGFGFVTYVLDRLEIYHMNQIIKLFGGVKKNG